MKLGKVRLDGVLGLFSFAAELIALVEAIKAAKEDGDPEDVAAVGVALGALVKKILAPGSV